MEENPELIKFKQGLDELLLKKNCEYEHKPRPFVCDGSPLDCDVFIVGRSSKIAMIQSWDEFWCSGYGFMKKKFDPIYQKECAKQEQGKKKTLTRRSIGEIVDFLKRRNPEISVVDTNIYSWPLTEQDSYTEPFDYLLKECKPKVIVTYLPAAYKHLKNSKWSEKLIGEYTFGEFTDPKKTEEIAEQIEARLGKKLILAPA